MNKNSHRYFVSKGLIKYCLLNGGKSMLKRNTQPTLHKKKKGQSTVEYIILVAAVIGAILVFVPTTFRKTLNASLTQSSNGMTDMANRIANSRP